MTNLFDEEWFSEIVRPSRYLGGEVHAVQKDPGQVEVSMALVFPDVYEVGMSHLGLKILYGLINELEWACAERAFSPWVDMEAALRKHHRPMTTLESGRPLSSFDVVGFSLQHELSYTNMLNLLDLAGIPPWARDRGDDSPLIVAGGPACFNPEPVADFLDLVVMGDGEVPLLALCQALREAKKAGPCSKRSLLEAMRKVPGMYVPSFFSVQYQSDGRIAEIVPLYEDYPSVQKSLLPDIEESSYPETPVIPFTELVHDRIALEIARGCTRGCRFCQAGMIYRPVRERSPQSLLQKARQVLEATGYDEISLLSLSSGDYSAIRPLLKAMMDCLSPGRISLALPSLRMDSLDETMAEQIKRVRKTGFTLAPEAGTDRLRRVINKGLTHQDILDTCKLVYGAGWNLIKCYFMVGLPFEEEEDLQGIVSLCREIVRLSPRSGKGPRLNASVATFVPKAHTPFMWAPQISLEESRRRIQVVREGLGTRQIHLKWNQADLSWLEGILARGDRRLGRVIFEAWQHGARFDSWGEHFNKNIWDQAFQAANLSPDHYLYRQRSLDEVLPWDHLHSGVRKEFLIQEWERAASREATPDCRKGCLECGVCDHQTVDPVVEHPIKDLAVPALFPPPMGPAPVRYRLSFTKTERLRHLGHLELVRLLTRAFRRAGLKMLHSQGFHPMPKMSFFSALPVGTESLAEVLDVELEEPHSLPSLQEKLNQTLPRGIRITAVQKVTPQNKKAVVAQTSYRVTFYEKDFEEEKIARFLKMETFPVVKRSAKGQHRVDARPLVLSLSRVGPGAVDMQLNHPQGPGLKPVEILQSIFELSDEETRRVRVLKTAQVLA